MRARHSSGLAWTLLAVVVLVAPASRLTGQDTTVRNQDKPVRVPALTITATRTEKDVFTRGGYVGRYEPIAIDGSVVVTHGRTLFFDPATGATRGEFDNVWVLRFGPDGRCSEFQEWYTGRPEHDPSRAMPER